MASVTVYCVAASETGKRAAEMVARPTLLSEQELCGIPGGHLGLPVPNSPYGLCGRNATLNNTCQN